MVGIIVISSPWLNMPELHVDSAITTNTKDRENALKFEGGF